MMCICRDAVGALHRPQYTSLPERSIQMSDGSVSGVPAPSHVKKIIPGVVVCPGLWAATSLTFCRQSQRSARTLSRISRRGPLNPVERSTMISN